MWEFVTLVATAEYSGGLNCHHHNRIPFLGHSAFPWVNYCFQLCLPSHHSQPMNKLCDNSCHSVTKHRWSGDLAKLNLLFLMRA